MTTKINPLAVQADAKPQGINTDAARRWAGPKPSIWGNSFNGAPVPVCEANLKGVLHEALDEIDALRAAVAELVEAVRREAENAFDERTRINLRAALDVFKGE